MAATPSELTVHVLWINAGLSCDGDSVSLTNATLPSVEDIALGAVPGLPKVVFHWPLVDYEVGDEFIDWFWKGAAGEIDPFVLVVEGSIPNEQIKSEGYWAGFGNRTRGAAAFGDQPMTTNEWIDRLAPKAWGVVAAGTCATYGGIHAMAGNPTGAMGLPDYLGWNWRSKAGLPIVCVPGCPVQPDNLSETLLYLLYHATGQAPVIPLDEALRPTWLFGRTVHEGCDRAGYYEQGDFAHEYGSPKCLVKIGCWGPVVKCNVPKRGWMDGIGGCPNVGGICIGCTMPGFPDKFMPFMDEPPGSRVSTAVTTVAGSLIRTLRGITLGTVDKEPEWRRPGPRLETGYDPPSVRPDKARTYRMGDESVTRSGRGSPKYVGKSVTMRGEDALAKLGREAGRHSREEADGREREAGTSTARDVSGVRPLDPIDPDKMPNLF
jgi:hydrogenase small subunit